MVTWRNVRARIFILARIMWKEYMPSACYELPLHVLAVDNQGAEVMAPDGEVLRIKWIRIAGVPHVGDDTLSIRKGA